MRRLASWSVALALAVALHGLVPSAYAQERDAAAGEAAVRLAYFAPGAEPVRLRVGSSAPFPVHASGSVSGYRIVPAGEQRVEVAPVVDGAAVQGADLPEDGAMMRFEPGAYYTLLVTAHDGVGAAPQMQEVGSGFRAQLIEDVMEAFPAAGWAWIRVVHSIEDGGAVEVRAVELDVPRRPREDREIEQPVIATELAFGTASGWSTIPAGSYALVFEGGDDGGLGFRSEATLRGGALYTLFVHGAAGETFVTFTVDALLREAVSDAAVSPENAR